MAEDKIPTYRDFVLLMYDKHKRCLSDEELAIEFAKMHVNASHQQIKRNCDGKTYMGRIQINPDEIEFSYPLENIK